MTVNDILTLNPLDCGCVLIYILVLDTWIFLISCRWLWNSCQWQQVLSDLRVNYCLTSVLCYNRDEGCIYTLPRLVCVFVRCLSALYQYNELSLFQLIFIVCIFVVMLHPCPRLGEGWVITNMFNKGNSSIPLFKIHKSIEKKQIRVKN